MKCTPTLTLDTDSPFWVTRDVFERVFDQADFRCRNQELIEGNYSKHWFYVDEFGSNRFLLPTVNLVSGKTQFINGRHRTAVLFERIDRIPIAFVTGGAVDLAKSLGLEPVYDNEQIELPDLPIVDRPE